MIKRPIAIVLLIMAFLFVAATCFAAKTSSCIHCHTNDAVMKALYKAPAMPEGEGEG